MIDIHTHTVYSDGADTPEELLRHAAQAGLTHLSITDHNSVSAYRDPVMDHWRDLFPGTLIRGVEITCMYEGEIVEVLGYGYALDKLEALLPQLVLPFREKQLREAELIAAVANLKAAIETFKAQVIAPNDLTSINALIAEAEEFIKANGNDDFVLALALEDAKAIVADADNHTKTEIAKAEKDLRTALEYARENVGVAGVVAEGFSIKVAVGNLVVEGLAGNCVIAVYTLDGRMIAFNETSESTFTLALGSGKYAVAVQGEGFKATQVVIVK